MKRHLITLACLLGAIACYVVGFGEGVIALAVAGLALEGAFWFRLFRRSKPEQVEQA